MKALALATLMLFLCTLSFPALAESYLCIAEQSTGFKYSKQSKEWSATVFSTDNKYVIRTTTKDDVIIADMYKGANYIVHQLGESFPIFFCRGFNEHKNMDCRGFGNHSLWFNSNTLRFQVVDEDGYVRPTIKALGTELKEGDSTPHLEIGKCSKI